MFVVPKYPTSIRLAVTPELGQLAKHLRMVGLDTVCEADINDGRVWVTSQPEFPHPRHLLRSQGYGAQLRELLHLLGLREQVSAGKGFFSLCLQCNHALLPVKGHQILERIGKDMLLSNDDFFFCSRCERVFPKGSYYQQMQKWLSDTLNAQ